MIGSSGTVPGVFGKLCCCFYITRTMSQSPRFRKTLATVAITTCRFHILEYFYKLHTRVVLYLSYAVVIRRFFDHSAQTDGRKLRRERAAAHENTYKITYHISDDHGSTDLFDLYLDFRTQFLSEPGIPGDL